MKYYALEGQDRLVALVILMIIAVAIPPLGDRAIEWIGRWYGFPSWLQAYDPESWLDTNLLGLSGLSIPAFIPLLWLFSRYVWRWPLVRRLLTTPPDLNGIWLGKIDRTIYFKTIEDAQKCAEGQIVLDGSTCKEAHLPVLVRIRQNWLYMSIQVENEQAGSITGRTNSEALTIGLRGDDETGYELNYTFDFSKGYGVNTLRLKESEGGATLLGSYASSTPAIGELEMVRVDQRDFLDVPLANLSSRSGQKYLGVSVPEKRIKRYLADLKRRRARDVRKLMANREERDGPYYHMTIVSPPEMKDLDETRIQAMTNLSVPVALGKLGYNRKQDNEAFYVTAVSTHAAYVRHLLGLPRKDFHVTLGFSPEDVHDVAKDASTHL